MSEPIPMLLTCPSCNARHIDEGEFATRPHHTHACQTCGMVWRPAIVETVGVQFLPGFRDTAAKKCGERRNTASGDWECALPEKHTPGCRFDLLPPVGHLTLGGPP